MLFAKYVEAGCVLLVMPCSDVLSVQYACYMCHTMTLWLSLWLTIDHHIDVIGVACIKLRIGHLWWSRMLAWNRKENISNLRNKVRVGCPRQTFALAWAGWNRALFAYLEMQKFNDVATTCSFFSDACTIEHRGYTVIVLSCLQVVWLNILVLYWTTLNKHLTFYALDGLTDWVTRRLSVTYVKTGS